MTRTKKTNARKTTQAGKKQRANTPGPVAATLDPRPHRSTVSTATAAPAPVPAAQADSQTGTKLARIVALLRRSEGATIADLMQLDEAGIRSKQRTDGNGNIIGGGRPIARGALYNLLQNRLYRGEIVHRSHAYPGQHDATVGSELWAAVQATFEANRVRRAAGTGSAEPALLTGLVFDGTGERMTPTTCQQAGAALPLLRQQQPRARQPSNSAETGRAGPGGRVGDARRGPALHPAAGRGSDL